MTPDVATPGTWDSSQNILVILAHPDDPEFFCGATLARWARAGHIVTYYLLTCGDKGYNDLTKVEDISPDDLCAIRHREQAAAASVIGAQAVNWLDAAGQVVLDAVFPASGNAAYFPELLAEGYAPHMPKEVWCSLTQLPTVKLDVTDTWPTKIEAILNHKSQIADVDRFLERMRSRHTEASSDEDPRFEENFRVISYR